MSDQPAKPRRPDLREAPERVVTASRQAVSLHDQQFWLAVDALEAALQSSAQPESREAPTSDERGALCLALASIGIPSSDPKDINPVADAILDRLGFMGYALAESREAPEPRCDFACSTCRDLADRPYAAMVLAARLDGRAVHAAWRDGMLAQGRAVVPERMAWETLDQRDRDLDDGIADRLAAQAQPSGSRE